jgi:sugar diacid utilization regulator
VVIVLEIAKRRAVAEAERTIRRDFVESLLARGASGMADMNERAHSLGWNLSDKHLVVLVEPLFDSVAQTKPSPVGRSVSPRNLPAAAMPPEFHDHASMLLAGRDSGAILAEQGSRVVLLPTCGAGCDLPRLKSSLLELISLIGALLVRATHATGFRAGIGGFGKDEKDLWLSLREANSVLDVVLKLSLPPEIYWFADLKLYCLLDRMSSQPETAEWVRHSIGPLLDLDASKGTQYVRTLEAYLDCCLRLKETAYLLSIHPKTLKYRLDKIAGILGVDLAHGLAQLDFHVACKMLRLMDTSRPG